MQLDDPTIGPIMKAKEKGRNRPEWESISTESASSKVYWAQWQQLELHEGVLCRRFESEDGKRWKLQMILPSCLRENVLDELHDSKTACHQGVRK